MVTFSPILKKMVQETPIENVSTHFAIISQLRYFTTNWQRKKIKKELHIL